jgi:hypothetical protein
MIYFVSHNTAHDDNTADVDTAHRRMAAGSRHKTLWKSSPKKASSFTLMALTLAACGGGGTSETGDSGGDNGGTTNPGDRTGNLLKGPIEGALVFADYNGNGAWDEGQEPSARTDSNGAYQLKGVDTQQSYQLVALLDGAVDNSSGNNFSSGSMAAPADAQVITPFTTIMVEQELSAEQVANVLGLGDLEGFDPLTFNPYGEGVDEATALAVEKTAHKVMAVVQALSVVYEQLGEDADTAFTMAMDVVADEVRSKAAAEETLALGGDQSAVVGLIDEAITRAQTDGHNTATIDGLKASIAIAVNNSIAQIEKVTTLSDDGEPNPEFQLITTLVSEIEEAISENDATKITLTDENVADAKVAELKNNTAPELILENVQEVISEATTNLVVAVVTVTDSDQDDQITISLRGPDTEFFEVTAQNEIVFKEQPNYEEKTSFNITVVASDGKEQTTKFVAISITDKEPLASLTINFSKLDGLDSKIEADIAAVDQAITGFYGGSGSRLVDEIETFLAEFEVGNVDVSSTGIVVYGADAGQQLALTFDNFSPNSLQSLFDTVSKFEETQDIDDLNISGGFSSLSISTADGKLVELAHTLGGIEWRNPNALPGDVDTFIIEGTFGNQLSDYIDILNVAQNGLESGASEIDVLLNAFEALSNQIEFTGISARAVGDVVFRIGDGGAPDNGTLEIFITGSDGDDHEFMLSLGGVTELATGFVEAAGGFDNFLLIAEASFGVDAYTYTSDFIYELNTSIIGSEEFSIISGKYNFADEYIFEDDYGTFTDLSMIVDIPPLQFEDSNGRPLSEQEYSKLIDIMEDVQDYLGGVGRPLDALKFGFSYEHGSDVVVAASVSEKISFGEAVSYFDDALSFVFAGYIENGVSVTEISDPQENFALKLIGVEKSDFLEKYQEQGDDILDTVELYFPASTTEVLSGAIV